METPEKKTVDQWAHAEVRRFIARAVLAQSNDLRRAADLLCVAHLQYDRPALPPR